MEHAGSARPVVTARAAGLVACTACGRLHRAGVAVCGRCGAALASRDETSLQRVWAWWAAGLVAYVPANVYPMLVTSTLGRATESTIVGGAAELAAHGDYAVALIVLTASVLIPVGKFVAIAYLALGLSRGGAARSRQMLYEVVDFIGRWSMLDIFVVAILSALVHLGSAVNINPGIAAISFALSVVFTMLSAQSFDPRLIWDAEDEARA